MASSSGGREQYALFVGGGGGVINGMLQCIRAAIIAALSLFALPAGAQLIDPMLSVQAATTSVGRAVDSTTIAAQEGQGFWSTRTFTAKNMQTCAPGSTSAVGIANGGMGITNVEIRNARGEVRITWNFGQGIPAGRFPYSGFEVDLVNTSQVTEVALDTVAVLSTNVTDITIGYPGVGLARKLSPKGKTFPFKFYNSAPSILKDSSTVIRSLTLRLSAPSVCDASFSVQLARLVPQMGGKSKSTGIAKGGRSSIRNEASAPYPQETAVATQRPPTNPCDEDPTVPDQIRECEEKRNFVASQCASWKCQCISKPDKSGYFISSSTAWSGSSSKGKTCTNNVCGGIEGRCSDWGECIPTQFDGYENPFIDITAEGISFRLSDNQISSDCFDENKQPRGPQLCTMTSKQVEDLFLSTMKVGAPCELTPVKMGVCDNYGQCVPDVTADHYCDDQVDCAPCGSKGKICWKKKCRTLEEAARLLCESTGLSYGGRGVCSQCYGMFKIHPDGTCGTGLLAPDSRGVSMDGASCTRYQDKRVLKGMCRDGQCIPGGSPTAPPGPTPGRTP